MSRYAGGSLPACSEPTYTHSRPFARIAPHHETESAGHSSFVPAIPIDDIDAVVGQLREDRPVARRRDERLRIVRRLGHDGSFPLIVPRIEAHDGQSLIVVGAIADFTRPHRAHSSPGEPPQLGACPYDLASQLSVGARPGPLRKTKTKTCRIVDRWLTRYTRYHT